MADLTGIPDFGKLHAQKVERDYMNMATYGPCPSCGAPREPRFETKTEQGKTVHTRRLACPNDHPQN